MSQRMVGLIVTTRPGTRSGGVLLSSRRGLVPVGVHPRLEGQPLENLEDTYDFCITIYYALYAVLVTYLCISF